MNSLLIVESENDKFFIEKLIDHLNLSNLKVSQPICSINEFNCLDGIGKFKNKLAEVKFENYNKIGVILDADNEGIKKRVAFINDTFKSVTDDLNITNVNTLYRSENLDLDVACHIMNIGGVGELENILIEIKSKDSIYADCLNSWRDCLKTNGKSISDKDFNKFWISNYFRFDTCSSKEKKQAGRKCSNEAAIKKDIWDLENPLLNDLKQFLNLFN